MLRPNVLQVRGPRPELSFRIRLLHHENPDVVCGILSLLPMQGFLLHVVVAGETIYTPAPSLPLLSKNMVERQQGTVYYNTTSQSICFCYGAVTESTPVNAFAEVLQEDLENLKRLSETVYEETITNRIPRIVPVTIERPDDISSGSGRETLQSNVSRASIPQTGNGQDRTAKTPGWQLLKQKLDNESARLRTPDEPIEIKRIRLGAVNSRSGGESSPFQTTVFLQGFLSTLGPHVFSRLLLLSRDPDISMPLLVRQTRIFLLDVFNHFDFLGDLGLDRMEGLGREYSDALDTLRSIEDYRALTDSMRTVVQLLYRWLHLIFPWYIKDQFPGRSREDTEDLPKLDVYPSM